MRLIFLIFIAAEINAADIGAIRKLFYEAVDGNRDSAQRASRMLDEFNASDPQAMAYRGSLLLLESSRSFAPWKKGKLAKEGLTLMDRAVAMRPEDLEIRFVRAASTRGLPGFFKRADESERDLAAIASRLAPGLTEPRVASASLLFHAENLEKHQDREGARRACSKAMTIAPGTPAADKCRARYASP